MPIENFGKDKSYKDGFTTLCKQCKAGKDRNNYHNRKHIYKAYRDKRRSDRKLLLHDRRKSQEWKDSNIATLRLGSARKSARQRGLEFNIDKSDIHIPTHCPLLGIELKRTNDNNRDTCPSLDRIDSSKGYIKGNVWIISYRANRIKNNATVKELRMVADNLEIKIKG